MLAQPNTTLWFWNTEIGWATVHPLLVQNGWEYRNCHIWNKGPGHIAGNANSQTLRKFPVVTEVCVQYVRCVKLRSGDEMLLLKDWLRSEWERTGLPLYRTNEACGVKNAATRKYFTKCHLWYFPPPEAFAKLVKYANKYGDRTGRPYFSEDGRQSISPSRWASMRAKFSCNHGISNVWTEPGVRGVERLRSNGLKADHLNQKPLKFMRRLIEASTEPGDVVWEPFGGLCSGAVACLEMGRRCFASEVSDRYFELAVKRLEQSGGEERRAAISPKSTTGSYLFAG